MTRPPVTAFALFFDEVRPELGNKLSMMGQYIGQLAIAPFTIVDRLAIVICARWPMDFSPQHLAAMVQLPRQEPMRLDVQMPPIVDQTGDQSPFAGHVVQAIVNMRFPPLMPGDAIEAWLTVDGTDLPAGRLLVTAQSVPVAAPGAVA